MVQSFPKPPQNARSAYPVQEPVSGRGLCVIDPGSGTSLPGPAVQGNCLRSVRAGNVLFRHGSRRLGSRLLETRPAQHAEPVLRAILRRLTGVDLADSIAPLSKSRQY